MLTATIIDVVLSAVTATAAFYLETTAFLPQTFHRIVNRTMLNAQIRRELEPETLGKRLHRQISLVLLQIKCSEQLYIDDVVS